MKLLESYNLGGLRLRNRVVMAPLTRSRATDDVANDMTAVYYGQRATAGLIISEGSPISREGQGYLFNPGIYTPEQLAGWRKSTDAVHQAGGLIFAQLWHVGRVSHTSIQSDGAAPVSASSKVARGALAFGYDQSGKPAFVPTSVPRQLSTEEIARLIGDFVTAAANAIEAGFDGVELHGAGGYIFEQFLNPAVNDRSDQYSATPLANRMRFLLETVDAVAARIGANRVGIRFSPFGELFDMPAYADAEHTYLELGRELAERKIAYVHLMDQSGFRLEDAILPANAHFPRLLEKLRDSFHTGAIIVAGGLTRERANQLIADGVIDLAAFGEPFISNPDLVARFEHGWPLAPADRATFYGGGAKGYIDYPVYVSETKADTGSPDEKC
ncbi:alkene reductase [Janthinobacterium sp.]|uniref:alkene reductase n=1 Tax=Janthinobacterium sp. TaxID=1871054 RepID=UPI00289A2825|nr:alkene reductase [Janthinobacterium sp.]